MCWAYLYAETSALCKLLSLTIAYFADDTLTGNWYPPKTVSKLTDRKWFSFSVSHEDNPVWWMFYHAELNSRSVTGFVLQLLVSSVFAWQAAIQSIRADMCERTDALLLAFCTPVRMDWHNAMLTVVDLNFETGWTRIWKLGFLLCCTLKDNYERKWFFFFNEKQISKIDSMVCLACVFWTRMCQCQMSVFYSGCKSCSVRPWPHFKIAVSLVSSWSNRPSHSNINKMWLLFSKPAPLKFLTPTPKWMAIGCFCSVVVKSPVNWEKNVTNI